MLSDDELDKLSFVFGTQEITSASSVLNYLTEQGCSSIPIPDVLKVLDGVLQRQLNNQVYAFHVYDDFAYEQSVYTRGEGVELFLRQGNRLGCILESPDRTFVPSVSQAVRGLNELGQDTIYTGPFPHKSKFLGINQEFDASHPVERFTLHEGEVEEFELKGIKVITLDTLV